MSPVVGPVGPTGVTGPGTAAFGGDAVRRPDAAGGVDFAAAMAQGLQSVQGMHDTTKSLAVAAATGDLTDVHDYMIAATQAQVATELTTAVRNKAVEAFQEIMRMQV